MRSLRRACAASLAVPVNFRMSAIFARALASAGPIPGSVSSSSAEAVLMLMIFAAGASAAGGRDAGAVGGGDRKAEP